MRVNETEAYKLNVIKMSSEAQKAVRGNKWQLERNGFEALIQDKKLVPISGMSDFFVMSNFDELISVVVRREPDGSATLLGAQEQR
ncbi:MAG: hypothetical protein AAGA48_28740 [Myxococcota bacterium]